jgi:hypothetical protein
MYGHSRAFGVAEEASRLFNALAGNRALRSVKLGLAGRV